MSWAQAQVFAIWGPFWYNMLLKSSFFFFNYYVLMLFIIILVTKVMNAYFRNSPIVLSPTVEMFVYFLLGSFLCSSLYKNRIRLYVILWTSFFTKCIMNIIPCHWILFCKMIFNSCMAICAIDVPWYLISLIADHLGKHQFFNTKMLSERSWQ